MIQLLYLNHQLEIQVILVITIVVFEYNNNYCIIIIIITGIISGKFLERGRISKPMTNSSNQTVYYQAEVL